MYECTPLYIPSNLGETELHMAISPGLGNRMLNPTELRTVHEKTAERRFKGYYSFIWVNSVKDAQRAVIKLSQQLEKHPIWPVQSNRLYFLPLFAKVGYGITVTPKKRYERPIIRVAHYPDDQVRTWNCEVYVSNLTQLQEALFSHERNLLKKRLQILGQQRGKV